MLHIEEVGKIKIKTGKLNNKELLDVFGTKKQKENYIRDKKLNSGIKKRILTKAKKYCDIEDIGKGNYIIHKVYDISKDDAILPLLKGLSKYITPLILTKLLTDQDENYKIILPFLGWARKFEMINNNYPFIKYHQKQSSEYLNISEEILFEYFEKMDDCIRYYLEKVLSTLSNKKELDLIEFDSVTMVRKVIIEPSVENCNLKIQCGYIDELISDEDRKFVIDCEDKAKKFADIVDNREKFYGVKSYIYKNKLKSLLSEKNILFTYRAYKIFCKNKNEVNNTLTKFKSAIDYKEDFIQVFNNVFIDYIQDKAKKIHKREHEKLNKIINDNIGLDINKISIIKKYRLTEAYINDFKALSELTVHKNSPELKDRIEVDAIEDILDEFNITIVKK